MPKADLTHELFLVDGKLKVLWSDGRVHPVVRGGDGSDGGAGDGGDGSGDGGRGNEDSSKGGAGSDDKSGSGDGESGSAKNDNGEGDGDGGDDKPISMTQEQFDALLEKRMAKARKSWEEDAKKKAEREKMDEAQRLKAEKEEAEKAAASKVEAANDRLRRTEVKAAYLAADGTDPKRADRFLRLVELDGIDVDDDGTVDTKAVTTAVDAALKEFPEFKATKGKRGASGGEMDDDDDKKPKTLNDAVAAKLAG